MFILSSVPNKVDQGWQIMAVPKTNSYTTEKALPKLSMNVIDKNNERS